MPHRYFFCTSLLCTLLCFSHEARAHGDNPLPLDVHAFEDGSWVLMTNFGVLTSDQPTRYVCEEIFLGGMNYQVLPFDTTTWLTLSADQLARTTDGGCTFEKLTERQSAPSAIARSQDDDLVAWLDNPQSGQSTLTWSTDRAETLERHDLSTLGPIQWTGLHIMDSNSLLATGYSEAMTSRGQARAFRIVLDDIERIEELPNWQRARYPYVFDARAGVVAGIANVDGALSLLWDAPERAVETSTPLEIWPVDMRLTRDGRMLGVAGATTSGAAMIYDRDEEGMPRGREIFAQDATSCFGWQGVEEVMLCARSSAQDFALAKGSAAPDVSSRQTLVDFKKLQGPIQGCAADTPLQKSCTLVWPELARALRIDLPDQPALDMGSPSRDQGPSLDPSPDMGSSFDDADSDMLPTPPSSSNDEKTCATTHPSRHDDKQYILLILLGFILTSRREKSSMA